MGFFFHVKKAKKLFPVARKKTYNLYLGTSANISFFGVKIGYLPVACLLGAIACKKGTLSIEQLLTVIWRILPVVKVISKAGENLTARVGELAVCVVNPE
jgi:hypothetical protein